MDAYEALGIMSHADSRPSVRMDGAAFMECPICLYLMGAHDPAQADRCLIQLGRIQGRIS